MTAGLDHLRIVAEAAAILRVQEGEPQRRRRDYAIRLAARHHSAEEIGQAAGLDVEFVGLILDEPVRARAATPSPISRPAWRRGLAFLPFAGHK